MALNKVKEIRSMSDWQVQVLRFTSFYKPEEQFDIASWWLELIGEIPETETKKLKERINIEEGPFKDGRLTVTKTWVAIDLRFQLPNNPPNEVNGIPTIGSFEDQCPDFIGLVKRLFEMTEFPSINRMAFGSIINLPSKDKKEGYMQLSSYLKNVKIDSVNSSEFVYQINRRRNSTTGIEGLEINRLNKWSVAAFKTFSASLLEGEVRTTEPSYACQLEIDINTCQEFKNNLPREKLVGIFDELVGMGKEIIARGDIE